ncbi:hypothetical protein MRB53_022053 [Persea americana]|uniref:Uncharacterized protein n=1 Tax=Persea americana TaxID=3435 RepID=A0ACC2L647_PERAE|nr:hypothetical protein MRB53_022053 [Persea americana]
MLLMMGVKEKAKVARQKAAVKPKPESETVIKISPDTEKGGRNGETNSLTNQKNVCEKSSKIKVTYVLTARRKAAFGINAINDIDSAGAENQLAAVDYVEDIYKFYRLMETPSGVPDYMTTWANSLRRTIRCNQSLSNWLIEVHNEFELMPETLYYLTMHIINQYLSMRTVLRRELQSVGVSAMFIASKYEEIWAPEVNDFLCITDMAYTREGILRMEEHSE